MMPKKSPEFDSYEFSPLRPRNSLERNNIIDLRKYTILIVDDSTYNIFVLEELLNDVPTVKDIHKAMNG
jgi:hypothetical protein